MVTTCPLSLVTCSIQSHKVSPSHQRTQPPLKVSSTSSAESSLRFIKQTQSDRCHFKCPHSALPLSSATFPFNIDLQFIVLCEFQGHVKVALARPRSNAHAHWPVKPRIHPLQPSPATISYCGIASPGVLLEQRPSRLKSRMSSAFIHNTFSHDQNVCWLICIPQHPQLLNILYCFYMKLVFSIFFNFKWMYLYTMFINMGSLSLFFYFSFANTNVEKYIACSFLNCSLFSLQLC